MLMIVFIIEKKLKQSQYRPGQTLRVPTPGHSLAGRIMSMKNSIDTIGNPIHDLLACKRISRPQQKRVWVWMNLNRINPGLMKNV